MPLMSRDRDSQVRFPPVYYRKFPGMYRDVVFTKFKGGQITDSGNNDWPPPKGSTADVGGPFRTVKLSCEFGTSQYTSPSTGPEMSEVKYSGPICTPIVGKGIPGIESLVLPTAGGSSKMNSAGATAISEVAPTNPHAQTATAFGEFLKDGLPFLPGIRTWKSRTLGLKQVGDEFLNYEFGWRPLVKDVKDVSTAIRDNHLIMKQYNKGSGQDQRRRFDFPDEKSVTTEKIEGIACVPGGSDIFRDNSNLGTATVTKTSIRRCWFSGAFTYTIPDSSTSYGAVMRAGDQAEHLLGVQLTPDVLWELTPWSWAIDWFSNASNVIHNVTSFGQYGLVMRYGYIMEENSMQITIQLDKAGLIGQSAPPPPTIITLTSKNRGQANPFGFGIGWEGLSPTQLAITAALGITRVLK